MKNPVDKNHLLNKAIDYKPTSLVNTISKVCSFLPRGKGALARGAGKLLQHFLSDKYIQTRYGAKLLINYRNIDFFSTMVRWDNSWEHWVFDTARWFMPENGVFYDIGSNVGYMTIEMLQVKPGINVIAFEPQPDLSHLLSESIKLNGFHGRANVINAGVSSVMDSNAILYIPAHTGHASIVVSDEIAKKSDQIKVKLVCLDDLLAQEQIPPPDLIKIDIEGHELDALQGAQQVLKTYAPHILFESSSKHHFSGIYAHIKKMGHYRFFYAIGSYRPVKEVQITDSMSAREKFDVIAVNMNRADLPEQFVSQIR